MYIVYTCNCASSCTYAEVLFLLARLSWFKEFEVHVQYVSVVNGVNPASTCYVYSVHAFHGGPFAP